MEVPISPGSSVPIPASAERAATIDQLDRVWQDPPGLLGKLMALQNDTLGKRVMGTAFGFFLVGGVVALLMRLQLALPDNNVVNPDTYNQFFTMHGSTMMYLFAVPMLEGFAILLLPFLLGNREMPFPRLGAFSFWIFLFGGLLFYSSFLFGQVPDAGWYAYTPLSGPYYAPGLGMDFWLLALSVAEVGALALGVEVIIFILYMRAPGMTLSRMPLFAWAMLVTAFMILFAFTPLLVGSALLEFDRKFDTKFFDPQAGGNPILWQHLFWIFGHPEVYIQFVPAAGMISMIVATYARRPVAGYTLLVLSMVSVGFLSFGLWVHHMFTTGLPQVALFLFALASMGIAIPNGVQIVAWITTLWAGRLQWKTPLLFTIGFIILFVIGGITGVMASAVPLDWQIHDTYFIVAHFHYTLIGGVTFPIIAALYYWLPKFTGRLLDERLGRWNFWLMFIGFNLTFLPLHIVGLLGMPRRVYTYESGWGWTPYNLIATVGAFILAAGILMLIINVIYSQRAGRPAGVNPWEAGTLEWSTTTPPPSYGFAELPIVHSRYPLWETRPEQTGDEHTRRSVKALSAWPVTWRAAMSTTLTDGRPHEIFRVSGPSLWPFIAAVGMILIFGAEVFSQRWLVLTGALMLLVSVVAWHWPEPAPTSAEEEAAFERRVELPVRTGGSLVVKRAGMALLLLILGIGLASLLFSYFFIRLDSPAWPPAGVEEPQLLLPAISLVLVAASAGLTAWGVRRVQADDQRRLRLGLGGAFVLGAAAVALMVYELNAYTFDWKLNAYASIFYTTAGFLMGFLAFGLLLSVLVQYWAWRGQYTPRHYTAVSNLSLAWLAIAAAWLAGLGTLYLTPLLS